MAVARDEAVRQTQILPTRGWGFLAPRLRGEGTTARRAWRGAYVRRLVAVDAVIAGIAACVGYLVRFGSADTSSTEVPFALALLLPAVWVLAMLVGRAYEERFLWEGPEEFRRVFVAAMMVLAGVGTVSWALQLEVARGFVVLALPLATALTIAARYVQRQVLHRAWERVLEACPDPKAPPIPVTLRR